MYTSRFRSFQPLAAIVVCGCLLMFCASAPSQATKPKLLVAADGFPSGHDTPEGVACDVMRALINRDEKLFLAAAIKPFSGGAGGRRMRYFFKRPFKISRRNPRRRRRRQEAQNELKDCSRRAISVKTGPRHTATPLLIFRM
jgi:hypothetical protein